MNISELIRDCRPQKKNNKMLFAVVEAMNYMELSKYKHITYTP